MTPKRYIGGFLALLITGLVIVGHSAASGAAGNISYGFNASTRPTLGSLVSLDSKQSNSISLADTSNATKLLGVVVSGNDSGIAVGVASNTVQVATSGTAQTLVSNINGDIKTGDWVGVSPFSGIGIKAMPNSMAVGIAQAGFNDSSKGTVTEKVTAKSGVSSEIRVGYIPVNIAVTNTNQITSANQNVIQKIVKTLTGHTVPTIRIVLSLIIAISALVILVTLIYASIYGSIVSVGRNPLAKYFIFRALSRVIAMAMLTAVIAGLAIYFLLR